MMVIGGIARLADIDGSYVSSGEFVSTPIAHSQLGRWKQISFTHTKPANTTIVYRVYDAAYTPLPDAVLSGNSSGFTAAPIDISTVSTSTYPSLRLGATLSGNTSVTPEVNDWRATYDVGPTLLPNVSFTMQGAKLIGSGPGGPAYKYSQTHSSGSTGSVALTNIEYDSYTLAMPSGSAYSIAASCGPQPTVVSPSSNLVSRLYLTPASAHSLLVDVKNASGTLIPGATVRLQRSAYDATVVADQCGQTFFGSIGSGSVGAGNAYTIDVSAAGYQSYSSSEINVSGTTRLSVILN